MNLADPLARPPHAGVPQRSIPPLSVSPLLSSLHSHAHCVSRPHCYVEVQTHTPICSLICPNPKTFSLPAPPLPLQHHLNKQSTFNPLAWSQNSAVSLVSPSISSSLNKACQIFLPCSRHRLYRFCPGPSPRLSSGRHNCSLGRLNNRHIFLMVLEVGKPKIKVPVNLVPDVSPPWAVDSHLLTTRESSSVSLLFIRTINRIVGPHPHDLDQTSSPPKGRTS